MVMAMSRMAMELRLRTAITAVLTISFPFPRLGVVRERERASQIPRSKREGTRRPGRRRIGAVGRRRSTAAKLRMGGCRVDKS
jgi:hypothetical protein